LLACLLENPSGLARLAGLVPEGTFRQASRPQASQGNPSGLARLAGLVPKGTFRQVSREQASQGNPEGKNAKKGSQSCEGLFYRSI